MKKYYFEAAKKQLEKATEPYYICCAKAQTWVMAENAEEAAKLACAKLHAKYDGTGVVLGEVTYVAEYDLPVDWSYGYGDQRKSGATADLGDLFGNNLIGDPERSKKYGSR